MKLQAHEWYLVILWSACCALLGATFETIGAVIGLLVGGTLGVALVEALRKWSSKRDKWEDPKQDRSKTEESEGSIASKVADQLDHETMRLIVEKRLEKIRDLYVGKRRREAVRADPTVESHAHDDPPLSDEDISRQITVHATKLAALHRERLSRADFRDRSAQAGQKRRGKTTPPKPPKQ